MNKIRILQIHNLEIGPEREESPFSTMRNLLDSRGLLNKIDYLAVCGNFTRDRSAESFEHASLVLGDMVREFLLPDRSPNRVILVPGPSDVPDSEVERPDFTAFCQLYQSFYQNVFEVEKKFDPQRAELRELKDLTLIGLTYWSSTKQELSRNRTRWFGETLDKAIRSMSSLAYVNTTPTLLISAGTPLFSNSQWPPAHPGEKIFNTDLRISFHLFGAGPMEYVTVPFSYDHVSLGLGSEAEEGSLWPLRVNLLELEGEPSTGERLRTDWTVLRQRSRGAAWESRTYMTALEAKNVPTPDPQIEELYFDFLARLSRLVFQPEIQMIRVQGFPGSGVSDVFTRLTREPWRKLDNRQVCIHGHRWQNANDFKDFLLRLGTGGATTDGCAAHLIVLYDPKFIQIANHGKKDHVKRIFDACEALFFQSCPFKVLYLTDFADVSLDLEGSVEFPFRALEGQTVTELLRRYAYRVPLRAEDIAHLTGGYAGLSQRFLRGCEIKFASLPGAQDIDERTSTALLHESFGHEEVQETCKRFRDVVKRMNGGTEVFDHIRKRVLQRYERSPGAREATFPHRVEVDFDELNPALSREVRDHLARYQILDRSGASNRYAVRVVAPFLGRRSTTVFFSYHSEDRGYVEEIKEHLEEEGRKERSYIRVFAYSADDRPFEESSSLEEELVKHLERSRNLCVFLLTGVFRTAVSDEIAAWKAAWAGWPPGHASRIAVVPDTSSAIPPVLRGSHPIPVRRKNPYDVAVDIFHRLSFGDMVWGLE